MPPEEPTVVQRADDGDEEAAHEARVAIKRHASEGGAAEWKDAGKGTLRLMRHKANGKGRIVVRNDLGKPTLNCALSNKMKFVAQGDAGVLFQAVVAGPDGQPAVQKLLLRTRKGEGAALHKQLEALAQAQAT